MTQTEAKGIVVYCASSTRIHPEYFQAARDLGAAIARAGLPLINGGGSMGLMGAVNDGAIAAGGVTIGVIPRFMSERGWGHTGLTRMEEVDTMHQRKARMASLARAAIALPGGIGTFEELTEIITWRKLRLFDGNVVILNTRNFYDPLLQQLRRAVDEGFINQAHIDALAVASTPDEALAMALDNKHPELPISEF